MDPQNENNLTRAALQAAGDRITQLQTTNEELQTFCASVAHDLHAPVRHILHSARLLQNESGWLLSEEGRTQLNHISAVSERMKNMIDELLEFSRMDGCSMAKSKVDVAELARETLAHFQKETRERNITWEIRPLPAVRADPALLRRVLLNLISNAVKFTGHRAEPQIIIGCAPGRVDETVIFISDNGAGFEPRHASKLFGVFHRLHTQEEFPGTGMGLAIVRRIIQRHGGRTWAQGEPDCGATFYFALPVQS